MKRTIKFRAWDKKRMFLVEGISSTTVWGKCTDKDCQFDHGICDDLVYTRRAVTLMQYTGLKDKKDAPIFEGDIVARNDDPPAVIRFGEATLEGSIDDFDFNGFYIEQKTENRKNGIYPYNLPLTNATAREVGVVGNEWENPSLLTQEKEPSASTV